ncbi:YdcF family protein [Insolitispirillum peregrinum]|uniref:Uncharacterized SAM-binding protein YcdF, DUF218 family n=1 Tax=Insolitispirillum peregrinum TaxID=80876 RepID=A0A1N7LC66_9PROT|nr:YdcF family protein [Insolitispirillum peregrinum]SIS71353.1 Uncharacterized SAM-binding protein YcdF, DUF218 family [Insolitispirillum peregrinum]
MFFVLSKVLSVALSPQFLLLVLLALALLASLRKRSPGVWLVLALLWLGVGDYSTLAPMGLNWLENRIPHATVWQQDDGPEGIIVLGGAIDQAASNNGRGEIVLGSGAERFTEALRLARDYPRAKVVFSGFSGLLDPQGENEGELAYRLATGLGLDPARIVLETRSRNTAENAREVAALLHDRPADKWVLITSAFHMARAVGCFQATGWVPQPWAVDYRTPPQVEWGVGRREGFSAGGLLGHEVVGLLAYWLTDRIPTLWPAPAMAAEGQVK